jgi:2-polyprenyl-6-methoxyphenol hydroxylase-like FAD-dependent oxidoreductase
MSFTSDSLPPRADTAARIALLSREFADVGWRASEFVAATADAHDFALDTYDQISVPIWHTGRVVLLGDSAWCASPLSGAGTALALLGAETLAEQLGDGRELRDEHLAAAFAAYQQSMTPATTAARKLPPGRVALYAPRTRLGIRLAAWVMRAIQSPLVLRIAGRHGPPNYEVA